MMRNTKKRITCFLFLLIFIHGALNLFSPLPTKAQEIDFPEISAHAAILMEYSSGTVIYAKNAEEPLHPASLTKIMTLVLVYDALEEGKISWDEHVTVSEKAWATGGSQMFLEIGQQVSISDLITGIATISANDACVAISEHLYGSEELFVQKMNRKANELELSNSHFMNASGLPDPEHYISAMDMARIAHYFIKNYPEALELHSQKEFTYNEIAQNNRNPLLGRYPGADGLKTGHTSMAGYCLVGTSEQEGMRFITVVMNASSNPKRLSDSETLLNYAFRNYTLHRLYEKGVIVSSVEVTGGKERMVDVRTDDVVEVVIPYLREDDVRYQIEIPDNIAAKIEAGTPVGHIEVSLDDNLLQTVPLSTASDVEQAGRISLFFRAIGDFFAVLWQGFTDWLKEIIPLPLD